MPNIFEKIAGYSLPGIFIITSVVGKFSPARPASSSTQHIACRLKLTFLVHAFTALVNPLVLFRNFASFKERAFANLWAIGGVICAIDTPKQLAPLLAQCKGVILDVGPGSGHQVFRFTNTKGIEAIYGAEPGESMHDGLRSRAKAAGLGEKYHVLNCEAKEESLVPALVKAGILKSNEKSRGSAVFDEIVCVRVLCGVENEREVVQGLYDLLKSGGRMVVCEHVVNSGVVTKGGSKLGRSLQSFYMNLGWPHLTGGCYLMRNTLATLEKAAERDGGWARVEVELVDPWSTVPHIVGVLTKR